MIDVRDVALAHVNALLAPDIAGKRIIIYKEQVLLSEMANILDSELSQYGYKVQTRTLGYCPLKCASFFDEQIKIILPFYGATFHLDNSLSK